MRMDSGFSLKADDALESANRVRCSGQCLRCYPNRTIGFLDANSRYPRTVMVADAPESPRGRPGNVVSAQCPEAR